jgi:hypothetical protein
MSRDKKRIYIAYHEKGSLKEFQIEGQTLIKDYGSVNDGWVYTNLMSPDQNYLFILSGQGTLNQLS